MKYHIGNIMLHLAVGSVIALFIYIVFGLSLWTGIASVITLTIVSAALNEVFPAYWRDE